MKQNNDIYNFIQYLYEKYSIEDKKIEYGYNDVSESHIVRINDDKLCADENFLCEVSNFSSHLADQGEWILFCFPSDVVKFNDFKPVDRFMSTEETFKAIEQLATLYDDNIEGSWTSAHLTEETETSSEACSSEEENYFAIAA